MVGCVEAEVCLHVAFRLAVSAGFLAVFVYTVRHQAMAEEISLRYFATRRIVQS